MGIKASQGTKKRKTASACKQLTNSEDLGDVDPSAAQKEVSHPPVPKIRVETKVESSILQIPVGSLKGVSSVAITLSAQGSSRCLQLFPTLPKDLLGVPVVSRRLLQILLREKEGQGLIPSSLILPSLILLTLLFSGLSSFCFILMSGFCFAI